MQSAVYFFVELLLVAWLSVINAYPSGPPLSACINMRPTGHGASTLSGTTPFTISTNTTFYTPGEKIEVTISGAQFVGFFVQARRRDSGSDMSTAVGNLTLVNTVTGKTLNCGGGTDNAWSHKTNAAKTSESAIWTAPSDDQGKIAFRATIVQGPSSDKYWTDVYSANLPFGSPAEEGDNGNNGDTAAGDSMPTPTPTSNGGGGVSSPAMSQIDHHILEVIGEDSPAVVGINGGADSLAASRSSNVIASPSDRQSLSTNSTSAAAARITRPGSVQSASKRVKQSLYEDYLEVEMKRIKLDMERIEAENEKISMEKQKLQLEILKLRFEIAKKVQGKEEVHFDLT